MARFRVRQRAAVKAQRQAFGQMTVAEYQETASEADIQGAITELLDLLGIVHSVTDASRTWAPDGKPRRSKVKPGWPDVSGVMHLHSGRALFIETKSANGTVRPEQAACHAELMAAGALVLVPRSVDVVRDILAEHGYRP